MLRIFRTENFKLTLLYAAVFSLSVFLLGVFVYFGIKNSLEHQIKHHIQHDTTQLLNDYEDDGIDELRHDIRERIEASPANRLLYYVQSPDGRVIFDALPQLPPQGWHTLMLQDGRTLLLLSKELKDGYRMGVGTTVEQVTDIQIAVRNVFTLAFFLTLIFGAGGGLMVSRKFLSRVDNFTHIAESIGEKGQLSQRLPLTGSGDDFDQLATTVNAMLGRIEQLMIEMKQVTTNIAHDLRTPLGRVRQTLEGLCQKGSLESGQQKKLEEAVVLLDDTLQTFSALMRIAEIESGSRRKGFEEIDLTQILKQVAREYAPVAEEEHHPLHANLENSHLIQGDKNLLLQLFVNLIENAIRHTPSGTAIYLGSQAWPNGLFQIIIADNGPGVPVEERQNILKPFYRLDPSRHSAGNGLGMSFVSAIASLHNAAVSIEDNCPGLRVVLTFYPEAMQISKALNPYKLLEYRGAGKSSPFFDDHPFADHIWNED